MARFINIAIVILVFTNTISLALDQVPSRLAYTVPPTTGTGLIDDTDAIQRTIDLASASGGGEVRLPPGTYRVSGRFGIALHLRDGVSLVGSGRGSTKIILDNNQNNVRIIKIPADASDIGVRHLTVDGNRYNQNVPTLDLKGIVGGPRNKRVSLFDVAFVNIYARQLVANEESRGDIDHAENWHIINCYFKGGGGKAIQFRAAINSSAIGNTIENDANDADASGIEASVGHYITISGNNIQQNRASLGPGLRVVNNSSFITISGNTVKGGRQGIFVSDSSDVIVSANIVDGVTGPGVWLEHVDAGMNGWGPLKRISVLGNLISNPTTTGIYAKVSDDASSGQRGTAILDLMIRNNTIVADSSALAAGVAGTMQYGIRIQPNSGTITAEESGNRIIGATSVAYKLENNFSFNIAKIAAAGNFFSGRIILNDNMVGTITLPSSCETGILVYSTKMSPALSGAFAFRVGSIISMAKLYGDPVNRVDGKTGPLNNGATPISGHMAGNLTFSAKSDGTIDIGNRLGTALTIIYRIDVCG